MTELVCKSLPTKLTSLTAAEMGQVVDEVGALYDWEVDGDADGGVILMFGVVVCYSPRPSVEGDVYAD